jgi:drug/metabolite transporter (DMT)-like permease
MDAPYSLPRLYVAALFAAAALAAVTFAGRTPRRRGWWLGVGLVAAGIAVVKAGSTVHADAMNAAADRLGTEGAVALAVLLAGGALAVLAFLSRAERRDRRRVLGALAAYAVASVGLSAVSTVAGSWYVTATFLEESGEALAGVAFLVAVLVGVAPRLVLPADWALRRREDAEALEPVALPERRTALGR